MINKDKIKLQYYNKLEYTVLTAKSLNQLKDKLNENYGKQGWEVVYVKEESDKWNTALLKRKLVTVDI